MRRLREALCILLAAGATGAAQAAPATRPSAAAMVIGDYHPILIAFGADRGSRSIRQGSALGGSRGGKWFGIGALPMKARLIDDGYSSASEKEQARNFVTTPLLKGGEDYRFYNAKQYLATVKGQRPLLSYSPASGNRYFGVKLARLSASGRMVIGISGEWDAVPRRPRWANRRRGTVDLDNDGSEETLTIGEAKLVREGEAMTQVKVWVQRGKKRILADSIEVDGTYTDSYELHWIDLDGDGKLELVTATFGHNTSVTAKVFTGSAFKPVLSYYMGD
jgi:hypothetical protein